MTIAKQQWGHKSSPITVRDWVAFPSCPLYWTIQVQFPIYFWETLVRLISFLATVHIWYGLLGVKGVPLNFQLTVARDGEGKILQAIFTLLPSSGWYEEKDTVGKAGTESSYRIMASLKTYNTLLFAYFEDVSFFPPWITRRVICFWIVTAFVITVQI